MKNYDSVVLEIVRLMGEGVAHAVLSRLCFMTIGPRIGKAGAFFSLVA